MSIEGLTGSGKCSLQKLAQFITCLAYILTVSAESRLLKHFPGAVGAGIINPSAPSSWASLPGILESDAAVDFFFPGFAVLADDDAGLGGVLLRRLLRDLPWRPLELLARLADR